MINGKKYFFFGRTGKLNRVTDADRVADTRRWFSGNYFKTAKEAITYKHLFVK